MLDSRLPGVQGPLTFNANAQCCVRAERLAFPLRMAAADARGRRAAIAPTTRCWNV